MYTPEGVIPAFLKISLQVTVKRTNGESFALVRFLTAISFPYAPSAALIAFSAG
jgi:hypothetical protein